MQFRLPRYLISTETTAAKTNWINKPAKVQNSIALSSMDATDMKPIDTVVEQAR